MEGPPDDFDEFLMQQRVLREQEAQQASQSSAERLAQTLRAQHQREQQRRREIELGEQLQDEATRVASAARGHVITDAAVGRFRPHYVGWILSIASVSNDNNGEGYSYRSWNTVTATILRSDGTLVVANPVSVKDRDYPLTSRFALQRVLRRTSGLVPVEKVDSQRFETLRTMLGSFVIKNRLEL